MSAAPSMSPDELTALLAAGLRVEGGEISIRPFAYATSHPMLEVRLGRGDGGGERLLAKDLRAAVPDAKPRMLVDPGRERRVYELVLPQVGDLAPTLRATCASWLVVEHVDGTELTQLGDPAAWAAAAAQLAELHAALADADASGLNAWDPALVGWWASRAASFTGSELLRAVACRADRLAERLLALPTGIVHGEAFPSNVVIRRSGRACFVDWELASVGPLLLDLAALVSGGWPDADRRTIALAYHASSGSRWDGDGFLEAVDLCRLMVAVQMLGWAPRWQPPAWHRHDWHADVESLAAGLGLL